MAGRLLWIAAVAGARHFFLHVMARERGIRDYARNPLLQSSLTDRLVSNLYATSHQQGAQHAIAAFLSDT